MKWRIKDTEPGFNPEPGHGTNVKNTAAALLFVAVFIVGILLLVFWKPSETVYTCQVDTQALGMQPVDLCALFPESIRQGDNVVVTGGFDKSASIMRLKAVPNTVYYNVLTSAQQVEHLVITPEMILNIEKHGFLGVWLSGVISLATVLLLFNLGRLVFRNRAVIKKKIQQLKPEPKKGNFNLTSEMI